MSLRPSKGPDGRLQAIMSQSAESSSAVNHISFALEKHSQLMTISLEARVLSE